MSRSMKPINHGTIGGHRAHHRRGEPMCEPCRNADREYRGHKPFRPGQCGTRYGHMAHAAKGEPSCSECRTARNDYMRGWRNQGLPDGDPRHGTETGYRNWGCRCESCKVAGSVSNRRQREARKSAS